jgi:hypothetical protein
MMLKLNNKLFKNYFLKLPRAAFFFAQTFQSKMKPFLKNIFYLRQPIQITMLKKLTPLIILSLVLFSCSSHVDTCQCWEELVTRSDNKTISSDCEYILDMSLEDIRAEVGADCVEKINALLFGDDDIEFNEDLDENAMYEAVDNVE